MITLMKQHVITTVMLAAIVSMAVSMLLVPRLAHAAFYYPAPTNYGALIAPATTTPAQAEPVQIAQAAPQKTLDAQPIVQSRVRSLTEAQVAAILGLLRAFGADEDVISAVAVSLN